MFDVEARAIARINKGYFHKQENIKYPKAYRDKLNQKILDILGIDENANIFDIIGL